MPRAPRRTAASKASSSEKDLDEETKKKCHSIIQDFDRHVVSRVEQSRSTMDGIYSQIRTKTNLLILQTPKDIQEMNLNDFETYLKQQEESDEKENGGGFLAPAPLPLVETGTLRKSRRAKKTTSSANLPQASTAIRKSTRSLTTPANTNRGHKLMAPTPMTIKTKFNIGTPLTKSICRVAKPDEPLISMSGSPVMLGAGTSSSISDVIKDLNDISKDKLLSIQSKISEALEQKK